MTCPTPCPVFCAIDTRDLKEAVGMARQLSSLPLHFKLGLEFFTAEGPSGVRKVREAAGKNAEIFLDLKFHDIPNTVAGAVRVALKAEPDFMTIHAAGGRAMIEAAVEAAGLSPKKPKILAVTVLTHLEENDFEQIGQKTPLSDQVLRLAELAMRSGADGVVCSPREVALLRERLGRDFLLVVPGIRPAEAALHDQRRTHTPEEAVKAGASHLVIGRPITAASSPLNAAKAILQSIER